MRYTVWSHPVETTYTTNIISKATVFYVLSTLLTVIPPLLIAYRSSGFWMKTASYAEQPDIHFKHTLIVILETEDGDNLIWSSREVDLQHEGDRVRVPLVQSREEDVNRDGILDSLQLKVSMPMASKEVVCGVKALVVFDYKLSRFSYLDMTGLIFISDYGHHGRSLEVAGDLRLVQKQPLSHRGIDQRFASSPLPSDAPVNLGKVLREYVDRNISVRLENLYKIWSRGSGTENFVLEVNINYPAETVLYTPGLWQTLKWGWIQYLGILVIFVYMFNSIKTFVFSNQVLPTICNPPGRK